MRPVTRIRLRKFVSQGGRLSHPSPHRDPYEVHPPSLWRLSCACPPASCPPLCWYLPVFDRHPFPALVDPGKTSGPLREALRAVAGARGQVAHVWRAMAYHGPLIQAQLALYPSLIFEGWGLDRRQCELLGTVTSLVNGCRYCSLHHGAPLLREGQDPEEVSALKEDPAGAALKDPRDHALRMLAVNLTRSPAESMAEDMERLAGLGFTDAQRAQAVLVIGYFAMMNRIANGLEIPLEPDYVETTR